MFGADTAAARLSHMCSPALVQDCVVRGASSSLCTQAMIASMPLSHDQILTAAVRDVMDSRDR